jgi:hypothetical protein
MKREVFVMRRNRYTAAFGAIALTAVTTAGCAAATPSAGRGGTAAGGTPVATMARATGGAANIMIWSVNSDGAYFRAIVSGVIGDYGPAVTVYPDGHVDPMHNSEMELKLARGTFRLAIGAIDKRFVKATSHEPTYPKTCSDLISVTGTTPIVAGSGTGAYRGISGSFPVTITLNEVEQTPCQPTAGGFLAQLITIAGSGTVSFQK